MCSLKALLNLTNGLIQCFCFKKAIDPSCLRAAQPWQLHTSISFQKVLKEEGRKTLEQGWEPNPKKYKANKRTKTQPSKEHNNEDTTNTQIK
jgi:hypothetical protein